MDELVVKQVDFASDRFWVSADRLADRAGHVKHARYLAGTAEATNRYVLHCEPCDVDVATFVVARA